MTENGFGGDCDREAFDRAMFARTAEMERTGEIYVHSVEIGFPPQLKDETGRDGLIIPIHEILHMLADKEEAGDFPRFAEEFRYIADKYYPEDEEDEEDASAGADD